MKLMKRKKVVRKNGAPIIFTAAAVSVVFFLSSTGGGGIGEAKAAYAAIDKGEDVSTAARKALRNVASNVADNYQNGVKRSVDKSAEATNVAVVDDVKESDKSQVAKTDKKSRVKTKAADTRDKKRRSEKRDADRKEKKKKRNTGHETRLAQKPKDDKSAEIADIELICTEQSGSTAVLSYDAKCISKLGKHGKTLATRNAYMRTYLKCDAIDRMAEGSPVAFTAGSNISKRDDLCFQIKMSERNTQYVRDGKGRGHAPNGGFVDAVYIEPPKRWAKAEKSKPLSMAKSNEGTAIWDRLNQ